MDTENKWRYVRVMVLTPVRGQFDYLPPENLPAWPLVPGLRVQVPFGEQSLVGIIADLLTETDCPLNKLKAIESVLDQNPLLNPTLFQLGLWLHRYYHCPIGEVWSLILPKPLRQGKPDVWPKPRKSPYSIDITEHEKTQSLPLNSSQQKAVQTLIQSLNQFQVFLLEGITGSGKTEVYLQTLEAVLASGKQALILVPEIALTPQTVQRFQARFSMPIAVFHSGLTDAQRYHAWKMAHEGLAPMVIGTRSAVFISLKNPGFFVIDEEHDLSFKQQEGIRYSARDVLIRRAQLEACPVVMGTATPSLETLHNVQLGKYQHLHLPERAGVAKYPKINVIDSRHARLQAGLSPSLKQQIQYHLIQQNQVLLFLNQRGFARLLTCKACNWKARCTRCDANLIYHHKKQQLRCHHCLKEMPFPTSCPECQAQPLIPVGVGTEKVESVLQTLFPAYAIIRIDRDVIQNKTLLDEALTEIASEKPLIILGTQMISKGHHFKKVTLVGILDCDGAFFAADFRSQERFGQIVTQVAGRSGRGNDPGEVILQTRFPEHPLLLRLLHQGYSPFAQALLRERKSIGLPPYSHQVLWRAEHKQPQKAITFLQQLRTQAQQFAGSTSLMLLGPIPATMEKRAGFFRAQLLMQAPTRNAVHQLTQYLIHQLAHLKSTPVRWNVDIDPLEMA